jgi:hypothetical protein
MENKNHDPDEAPQHVIAKTETGWKNACLFADIHRAFAVHKQKTDIKALNALELDHSQPNYEKFAETVREAEIAEDLSEHDDGDYRGPTR